MCSPIEGPRRSETSHFYKNRWNKVSRTYFLTICIYIYIYIYILQQVSLKYVVFESTLLNFTQNPYEIGPSIASQGQHRRKDATE